MSPLVLALLALDMGSAARDLARGVASAVAHEPVVLEVRNTSALAIPEIAEIRRAFDAELKTVARADTEVRLTLSENQTDFVLVAEIRRAGGHNVLLDSWPRTPNSPNSAPRVTLERKLLWEQDQPILDAAPQSDWILVLDAARVLLVHGAERQSVAISNGHTWPRDLRGHLSASAAAFTAWLPGVVCRGSIQPQLAMDCRDSPDPWLLAPGALAAFSPDRNFFNGRIVVEPGGARTLPPFYTGAPTAEGWVLAGVDGHTRIYTPAWELAATIDQWGSDIAAIQTPCGARVLATRAASPNEPDSIQPYEIQEGRARVAGPMLEFPGPVTALWSAGSSAIAVTHDLETGRYAAFSLAPACGS